MQEEEDAQLAAFFKVLCGFSFGFLKLQFKKANKQKANLRN